MVDNYQIQNLFISKKMTLSLAESCTGGAIAAHLVKVSGCSDYFLGSIVAYSNDAKTSLLKVPHEVIVDDGAVSKNCVEYMVKGAAEAFQSDVACAVTGIAGPLGGLPHKEVGTVYFAIYHRNHIFKSWKCNFKGSREEIIDQTVQEVLNQLSLLF